MKHGTTSYRNTYRGGRVWTQAHSAGRALRLSMEEQLNTQRFGRCLLAFQEIDSTNSAAAEWAAAGAPEGAVVTAEIQTAGRGRFGRTWMATPGQNLTFSVILQPQLAPESMGLVVLGASVAVARALAPETDPLVPQIKWPNDILINGRKCCGMLLETSTSGASPPAVAVLGIGLNVNQDSFPPEIASTATSLLLEIGRLTTRTALLARILNRLEEGYDAINQGRGHEIRRHYVERMAGIGQRVRVHNLGDGQVLVGIVEGIGPTGSLALRTPSGIRFLQAGEVTLQAAP